MLLDYIQRYEKNSIVSSIIMIIISLLLIFMSETILKIVVMLYIIGVFIDGIIHIIAYIVMDNELQIFSYDLIQGVVMLIASIFLFMYRDAVSEILPMMIGVWIIIKSVIKIQIAFNLQCTLDSSSWVLFLLSGIVTCFIGIALIINPFSSASTLIYFSGIFLLIAEVFDLVESIIVLKRIQ